MGSVKGLGYPAYTSDVLNPLRPHEEPVEDVLKPSKPEVRKVVSNGVTRYVKVKPNE